MQLSKYRLSLDIHETNPQALVRFNYGDTSRSIDFVLTEYGKPFMLSDNVYAFISAIKPDGTSIINECTVDSENNKITYDVTDQTTSAVGRFDAQLTFGTRKNPTATVYFNSSAAPELVNHNYVFDAEDVTSPATGVTPAVGNSIIYSNVEYFITEITTEGDTVTSYSCYENNTVLLLNRISAPIFSIEVRAIVNTDIEVNSTSEFDALVTALNEVSDHEDRISQLENDYDNLEDTVEYVEVKATESEQHALDSEAYALGTRGGQEVTSEDATYHNNAKYYKEQAALSATAAAGSAAAAATSETNAGNSASAAAGSASAAASSAQEAGDHEDQAFIYRNEAEGFKEDAEDAKTAAEAAENAAQGFANEAYQSAQEAAEEVAQNAARTVVAELSNDGLYKLTISLKNGTSPATVISTAVVDFPLEGIKIVSGAYDSATGNIVLTLQNGQKITFPVSEIITGLATETYVNNRKVTACAFNSSKYILTLTFGDNSTLTADFSAIETYIDSKAAAAEQNAKNYADDAADAALSEAKTYAEDKADDAELNAKAYTNNLLDELGLSVVDGKLCITYSEV